MAAGLGKDGRTVRRQLPVAFPCLQSPVFNCRFRAPTAFHSLAQSVGGGDSCNLLLHLQQKVARPQMYEPLIAALQAAGCSTDIPQSVGLG